MRNLKRALSLLLSSTMVLGMLVMGSSAASYTDVTSEENVEAIEVLKAVGVMTGDENGNFNPDKQVTRAEMAVVMANLLDLKVEDFKGASLPFTDVPEWAVPYVAACYADGITAGISATEYGSNNSVTTAQAALMMMKALGYFQYSRDFGSDWQVATVKQGSKIDLFDGIEAGASAAMTRNDVAQIALNTLKATMVETDGSSTSITLPGGIVIDSGDTKYVDVTSKSAYAKAFNDTAVDNNGTYAVQLGEKLYNGDLKLNATASHDDFGAPANVWTYKDFTGKYAKNAILTYTDEVKPSDLADDIEDAGYKIDKTSSTTSLTVWSNGDNSETYTGTQIASAISTNTAFGGKGIELKVYDANDDDTADTIVMVYTYAAKVTTVTEDDKDTSKDERALSVEAYMGGNKTAKITLDKDTVGFDSVYSKVEEDDIVLVTPKNDASSADAAWTVSIPESVTGAVTATNTSKNTVTVDGTTYNVAACERAVSSLKVDNDKDIVLYLDTYGNAIYTTAVSAATNIDVVYVTYVYTETNSWGETVNMFQGVLTDGTTVTAEYKGLTLDSEATQTNSNKAYKYEMDGDTYVLSNSTSNNGQRVGTLNMTNFNIDKGDRRLSGTATNFFDGGVKFVYVDGSKGDLKVTVKEGVQTVAAKKGNFGVISEDADGNLVVTTVFVNDTAATASDDLIYVAEQTSYIETTYGPDGKTKLYGYEVYLNGEETVVYKDTTGDINASFYTYTVNDTTGVYTLKSTNSGIATDDTLKNVTYIGGTYYVSLTTETTVADYNATDAQVIDTRDNGKVDTMSELKDNASSVTVSVVYDKDAETVQYIYVK